MSDVVVAVLVPPIHSTAQKPTAFPIAKALQQLESRGIITVFGFDLYRKNNTVWINGKIIENNLFKDTSLPIKIIHDRFPSQIRNNHFSEIQSVASSIAFGNPFSTTLLCRDKLACQRLLEQHDIAMPQVISDPTKFASSLAKWGQGFIKPQFGALGKGVQAVTTGMPLPHSLPGVVPNRLEPSILQRAVSAPAGWAGMSVRQLMQKSVGGSWIARTAVLRCSTDDPVVNVSRGAKAIPAVDMLPTYTIESIQQQSVAACRILDGEPNGLYNVEFGLDFVIDPNYKPWLIEVNSRPRGRLEYLASTDPNRFLSEHEAACVQPIRYLASLCQ